MSRKNNSNKIQGCGLKRKSKGALIMDDNQEKDRTLNQACSFPVAAEDETTMKTSCRKTKKMTTTKKRYKLLCFHELPDYMKDNEFILKYYRSEWPLKLAFLSLFRWHNETLNVWT